MRYLSIPFIFTIIIALSGCANFYFLTSPAKQAAFQQKFNAYGQHYSGVLVKQDGTTETFYRITLHQDTLLVQQEPEQPPIPLPTAKVQRVIFTDHIVGASQGVGLGILVGGIAGGFYIKWDFSEFNGFALLGGGLLGGIAGAIIGGIKGSSMVFVF